MDQSVYIDRLEMELNQSKNELTSAREEINGLNINNESLTSELQKAKTEMSNYKKCDIKSIHQSMKKSHCSSSTPERNNS